ncbi:excalibur calcium-binding domain-containing protein [Streptomyces sp. NPDC046881]
MLCHAPAHADHSRACADARAHHDTPVLRGDPGCGPHLDRDNDGIGCEWG